MATTSSPTLLLSNENKEIEQNEPDELDELLGLLDEEEKVEQTQKSIESKQKKKFDAEIYVSSQCKLRVDPKTRAISSESLQLRLRRWTIASLSDLPSMLQRRNSTAKSNTHAKNTTAAAPTPFVTVGILASKTVKTSKNNNTYLLIKLDDFEASISCFMFNQELIEKFYKIQVGTVLVLADPKTLDSTNSGGGGGGGGNKNAYGHQQRQTDIALKVEDGEQILVVGKSIDFGFCNKELRNASGKCQSIVNKTKADLCPFHAAQQYKRYASRRSDTNRSSLSSKLRNQNKRSLTSDVTIAKMTRPQNPGSYSHARAQHNMQHTQSYLASRGRNRLQNHRSTVQIEQNKRKQEMNVLLKGKTLLPQLGTNWQQNTRQSSSSSSSNRGGVNHNNNNHNIVLSAKPSMTERVHQNSLQKSQLRAQQIMKNKNISFAAPNPNDMKQASTLNRKKRSFECITSEEQENVRPQHGSSPPRKRHRLAHIGGGGGGDDDTGDAEAIMSKKSINDSLRSGLEKDAMFKELDALQDEEKLHDQLQEISSLKITVFICRKNGCSLKDKAVEKANTFCKAHAMDIVRASGVKYFWQCNHCKFKIETINTKRIKTKCGKCGKRNFVPSSCYNLRAPKSNPKENKLILVNNKLQK